MTASADIELLPGRVDFCEKRHCKRPSPCLFGRVAVSRLFVWSPLLFNERIKGGFGDSKKSCLFFNRSISPMTIGMEKRRQLKCVRQRQLYRNREQEPDPPPFVQVANHVWQLHHDAARRTPLTGLPLDLRRWRLGEREQGVGKVCIVGAGS